MAEQLLSTAVHDTLPGNYVRPESQRPRLAEVVTGARIPVVDLGCPDRAAAVAAIGDACRSHGFFQVLNHGIHADLIASVMAVARDFFRLPAEEKAKLYSDDPARKIRLSTSFNVRKETVHNWRDYLRLHCHPLDESVPDWPSNPPDFKDTMSTYCKEVRELGFRPYSLGLEPSYMKETLGEQEQHMAVNFYPPCPEPELTYGLPAHTDPNALTILLMDQDVAGLQVLHGGKWVAVNPQPGALIINIGDQLQVTGTPANEAAVMRKKGLLGSMCSIAEKLPAFCAPLLIWLLPNSSAQKTGLNLEDPWMQVFITGSLILCLVSFFLMSLASKFKESESIDGVLFKIFMWMLLPVFIGLWTGLCMVMHFFAHTSKFVLLPLGILFSILLASFWFWGFYKEHQKIQEELKNPEFVADSAQGLGGNSYTLQISGAPSVGNVK